MAYSGGVQQPYNAREAAGQDLLRSANDGTYAKETYLAHLGTILLDRECSCCVEANGRWAELRGEGRAIVLTNEQLFSVDPKRTSVEWHVPIAGK